MLLALHGASIMHTNMLTDLRIAKESGYDDRVQLSYAGNIDADTFKFSTLNRDSNDKLLKSDTELDASLVVDGVSITRSSNAIDDVIEGLTLNLMGEGQASATISGNSAMATDAVNSFISNYNGLRTQMADLSSAGFSGRSLQPGRYPGRSTTRRVAHIIKKGIFAAAG